MPEKLSAFVISYNRASLLETCLRAAAFADELIVIDKSSTDNSAAVASRYADRVERVPWSPTVEETRAFAASLCRHEWILYLDDDEILSSEAGPYLQRNLADWNADVLAIPQRHYILGVHDERAYYWPEQHYRLFRKGAIEFIPIVHGGVALQSERRASIPVDSGVCTHHLSYQDVADWIARTNRYTSRPNRVRAEAGTDHLIRFAHDQIDYWMQRTDDPSGNDYPAAVALLRAIYDMVDRLKSWETERGVDGAAMFRIAQQTLVPATGGREHRTAMRAGDASAVEPAADDAATADSADTGDDDQQMALQEMRVQLQTAEAERRQWIAIAGSRAADLADTVRNLDETTVKLTAARQVVDDTRATLQQTRAVLDQTMADLHATQQQLGVTSVDLADARHARQASERVSDSAQLFIRQYLPKLRRHLLRRLLRR